MNETPPRRPPGPAGAALLLAVLTAGSALLAARTGDERPRLRPVARPTGFGLVVGNQLLGQLEPCGCSEGQLGGLPRRYNFIRALGAAGRRWYYVENGDLIKRPSPQERLKLPYALRALKAIGCWAWVPGENDLALGREALIEAAHEAGIPLIAANIRHDGRRFCSGAVVESTRPQGPRLAVVGLLSTDFGALLDSLDPRWQIEAPAQALHRELDGLRGDDIVVVIYHGSEGDAERLFKVDPRVRVVFAGHGRDHGQIDGRTLVLPQRGTHLGTAVFADATGRPSLDLGRLGPEVPDAIAIRNIVTQYVETISRAGLVDDVERVPLEGGGSYVTPASCRTCHPAEHEVWAASKHARALVDVQRAGRVRDPECLACHTTGFGYLGGHSDDQRDGPLARVSCESCHGPGSEHVQTPTRPYGRVPPQRCQACHDPANSPRFDFPVYWPKIRHGKEH